MIVLLLIPYFWIMAIFYNYDAEYVNHLAEFSDLLFYRIRPIFVLAYHILFGIYILKRDSTAKNITGIFSFVSVGIYYCFNALCKVIWIFADSNNLGFVEVFKDIFKGIFPDLCSFILIILFIFTLFHKRKCRKSLVILSAILYFVPLVDVVQRIGFAFENSTAQSFADAFNFVFSCQPELLFLHIPLIIFSFFVFKEDKLN